MNSPFVWMEARNLLLMEDCASILGTRSRRSPRLLRHGSNALDSFRNSIVIRTASDAVRNCFGTVQQAGNIKNLGFLRCIDVLITISCLPVAEEHISSAAGR